VFDQRVLKCFPKAVVFRKGQLVQVHRNDLDYTFKSERKLLPRWSQPRRVRERLVNSYKLETLDGTEINGLFSSRRLRAFDAREGTELFEAQRRLEDELRKEELGTEGVAMDVMDDVDDLMDVEGNTGVSDRADISDLSPDIGEVYFLAD
jgi:hypothetical protein